MISEGPKLIEDFLKAGYTLLFLEFLVKDIGP